MNAFLSGEIDAAAAMTYNELAQVLETKNPKTGKLYTLSDLNVFKMSDPSVGTGMLEDNLFVTDKWLSSKTNQDTLVKFLKASFQGWIYCRDHQAACVKIVLDNGPTLGAGHQAWQMNEINALVWPNPSGIGARPGVGGRADGGDREEVRRDQEHCRRARRTTRTRARRSRSSRRPA